jgi:hypothetical protein
LGSSEINNLDLVANFEKGREKLGFQSQMQKLQLQGGTWDSEITTVVVVVVATASLQRLRCNGVAVLLYHKTLYPKS